LSLRRRALPKLRDKKLGAEGLRQERAAAKSARPLVLRIA
jgi:hypothetical protein